MHQCDICNKLGVGKIVPAAQMSQAVREGFDPFALGLANDMGAIVGMDTCAQWKRSAIDGVLSKTDWNVCSYCMPVVEQFARRANRGSHDESRVSDDRIEEKTRVATESIRSSYWLALFAVAILTAPLPLASYWFLFSVWRTRDSYMISLSLVPLLIPVAIAGVVIGTLFGVIRLHYSDRSSFPTRLAAIIPTMCVAVMWWKSAHEVFAIVHALVLYVTIVMTLNEALRDKTLNSGRADQELKAAAQLAIVRALNTGTRSISLPSELFNNASRFTQDGVRRACETADVKLVLTR